MKMCLFRIFEVKKKDKLATYIVPNFKHGPINLYKKIQITINIIHRMTSFAGISIHTLLMSRFIIYIII